MVKALLRPTEDEPQPRRRRSGDTDKAFGMAAKTIMRRAARLPSDAYAAATAFLSDAFDWLNLWHNDTDSSGELNDIPDTDRNHLFPHL